MATTRKGGHKALKASHFEAEKENRPPPKGTKRTAPIAGMFDNPRNVRRKTNEENNDDEYAAKAAHKDNADGGFFKRFSSKRQAEQHPLYLRFAQAAKDYQEGAAASGAEQLEPVYQELVARANGLDINGRPLEIPGVPTLAQIDALDAEGHELSKPIGEQILEVQVPQPDGSLKRKHVTLDASMKAASLQLGEKRAELEKLERDLAQVYDEIDAAKEDALNDKDGAIKRADDKLQARLDKVEKDTELFRNQTFNEVVQAEKADKAAAAETNRKIQEFMKALQ
ncbi:hypothetical protein LTR85_006831 [Meristemomyces frigidus]|nr:hypothetical protein LTR85_006831 [Meristemomyces frigidus]